MIMNHSPRLCIKLAHVALRPVAVSAMAGSLDEAERTIILQALDQCIWRIRGSNGAAALLDIKPTTLEARIKKLGLQQHSYSKSARSFVRRVRGCF
jgi:transcriptional regulator with GAF, ATPase, and Fis domain